MNIEKRMMEKPRRKEIMEIHGITVDTAKGFDVVSKTGNVIAHVKTYEEAVKLSCDNAGGYIRYYAKTEGGKKQKKPHSGSSGGGQTSPC